MIKSYGKNAMVFLWIARFLLLSLALFFVVFAWIMYASSFEPGMEEQLFQDGISDATSGYLERKLSAQQFAKVFLGAGVFFALCLALSWLDRRKT